MKTYHPKTGIFFKSWELNSLDQISENVKKFDQKRKEYQRLQRWSMGIYISLISLFFGLVYLAFFVLEIPKISLFNF